MRPLFLLLALTTAAYAEHGPDEAGPRNGAGRAAADVPPCEVVPHHGEKRHLDGTLSPFWAQEYIGLPYLTRLLTGTTLGPVRIGVIDGGFQAKGVNGPMTPEVRALLDRGRSEELLRAYHGTCVSNLINGGGPAGYPANVGTFVALAKNEGFDSGPATAEALKASPDVVNVSQTWGGRGGVAELDQLAKSAIVVRSAGNHFPDEARAYESAPNLPTILGVLGHGTNPLAALARQAASAPDQIMVGNIGPEGFMSPSSQAGMGVVIAAPSDMLLRVKDETGYRNFGGTSGAAPLVTGAVAMTKGILGSLTLAEMKRLLQKTAIPTLNSKQVPPENGAGTLNAFKLAKVALRLKAKGWPANREALIADPETFNFTSEANELLGRGKRKLESSRCEDKQEGYALVNQAFLLAAGVGDSAHVFDLARKQMVRALTAEGLTANAAFYQSMEPEGPRAAILRVMAQEVPTMRRASGIVRALSILPPTEVENILTTALATPAPAGARTATLVAIAFEPPKLSLLLRAFRANRSVPARAAMAETFRYLGPEGKDLFEAALSDESETVRNAYKPKPEK